VPCEDIGQGSRLGLNVLQVRLPAQFLVKYHTQNISRRDGVNNRGGEYEGAGTVIFVLALVKCTRIYFSGAKDAPCLLA
jgi:hypothetical protein